MPLAQEIREAIEKLPRLEGSKPYNKHIARIKLVDQNNGWEYYLTAYNPRNDMVHGLVFGWSVDYGSIRVNAAGVGPFQDPSLESKDLVLDPDFEPTVVEEIENRS